MQPLKFVEPQTPVRIGERVLAIGSALTDDASVLTLGMRTNSSSSSRYCASRSASARSQDGF